MMNNVLFYVFTVFICLNVFLCQEAKANEKKELLTRIEAMLENQESKAVEDTVPKKTEEYIQTCKTKAQVYWDSPKTFDWDKGNRVYFDCLYGTIIKISRPLFSKEKDNSVVLQEGGEFFSVNTDDPHVAFVKSLDETIGNMNSLNFILLNQNKFCPCGLEAQRNANGETAYYLEGLIEDILYVAEGL